MKQSNSANETAIQEWAARQLADYDACQPGKLFAEDVHLSLAEGYQLQAAIAKLRCSRGEQIVGYKVGCTSPTIRAQLGIDHCVTGRLYDTEHYASGVVLSRDKFANLAIEGELAVELSHEPTESDFTGDELPACVARVFPVIELHNHVMRGLRPSAGELVANNAIHAGFVAGRGVAATQAMGQATPGSWSLAICVDDQPLDQCAGLPLLQTIRSSLKWLMELMRDRDDHLRGSQIVLAGSILPLFPIESDCRVRVEAPPLGNVEVEFTG